MSRPVPTGRALAAAQAVALAHRVGCEDAVTMAGASNVLVHLRPAPVVARVMTGTAVLHDDVEAWLAREVAVGAFLADRGLGVPPSDLLAPGPYEHDGLWMTMWSFVDHDASPAPPPARDLGAALRELHDALAGFAGELRPLGDIGDWLDGLLARLHPSPTLGAQERDALRARLHALTPAVFESALAVQPIHGDASTGNLLRAGDRLLWSDLEDVCTGPVHWDVAGLVDDARATGASERFVAELLDAYGAVGLDELDDFLAAHRLYTAVWRAFTAQERAGDAGSGPGAGGGGPVSPRAG